MKSIKKKIRRWKREHDEESPASEPEEPDEHQIQSHVPVLTVEDGLFNPDGLISPPPPPPETLDLPPPPPEDGGKPPPG